MREPSSAEDTLDTEVKAGLILRFLRVLGGGEL
jgi:hypothetical protein